MCADMSIEETQNSKLLFPTPGIRYLLPGILQS